MRFRCSSLLCRCLAPCKPWCRCWGPAHPEPGAAHISIADAHTSAGEEGFPQEEHLAVVYGRSSSGGCPGAECPSSEDEGFLSAVSDDMETEACHVGAGTARPALGSPAGRTVRPAGSAAEECPRRKAAR
uniref:Uncharacterized protein n=1 Tax=Alexandrium catenella TaxID=2925 RepID=A0A7S1W2Z1_ALECA|mmetsp:Transcript_37247/g.100786  ORF Transcript_37247/g.100786 Transcript_37247/m.100786 type:complete len:130 (+) Transcript_37247:36-425(+)